MKKIKVAFIYHKNNIFLSGNHFDNTFYNFYIKALRRNENLEITNFMTDDVFDCSKLKGKFDIILLWENSPFGMPKELIGIKDIDPVDHGTALSIYFPDPEGNRIEIYMATPWYIKQPHRQLIDFNKSDVELLKAC